MYSINLQMIIAIQIVAVTLVFQGQEGSICLSCILLLKWWLSCVLQLELLQLRLL